MHPPYVRVSRNLKAHPGTLPYPISPLVMSSHWVFVDGYGSDSEANAEACTSEPESGGSAVESDLSVPLAELVAKQRSLSESARLPASPPPPPPPSIFYGVSIALVLFGIGLGVGFYIRGF